VDQEQVKVINPPVGQLFPGQRVSVLLGVERVPELPNLVSDVH
jgi:hypothetical protein